MPTSALAQNPQGGREAAGPDKAPADDAPILELAFVRAATDRAGAPPAVAVSILTDGTVLVPDPQDPGRPLRGRLSPEELQALLSEVVDTQRIFECDTEALSRSLQNASRQTGLAWRVPLADTTVIRVRHDGQEHEVRCLAAELLEERFPGVDDLRRLCRVQRRLQNIGLVVLVGGPREAERLTAVANQELRRRGVAGVELTSSDLQQVLGGGDGFRFVQFQRCEPQAPHEGETQCLVSITETPDGPPRVSVTTLPQRRR
jgi:hypothetical protein